MKPGDEDQLCAQKIIYPTNTDLSYSRFSVFYRNTPAIRRVLGEAVFHTMILFPVYRDVVYIFVFNDQEQDLTLNI